MRSVSSRRLAPWPAIVFPVWRRSWLCRRRHKKDLRHEGIKVLLGPGGVEPHPPHTGGDLINSYPWHLAMDEAERLTASPDTLKQAR
jgi:hypothetical protein